MKLETETSIFKHNAVADAIDSAMTAANGKNRVFHQNNQPSGSSYTVGDTWFDTNDGYKMYRWSGSAWVAETLGSSAISAGAVEASHIDAGAVTADKLSANAVTAGKIASGAVTADKLEAGAITAEKIAANAVTVDKLVVGDMSNLATVNEWDDNSMVKSPASMRTKAVIINTTTGLKGIVKYDENQTQLALSQYRMPNSFKAGDEIYFSLRARAVAVARSVTIRVAAYDANKTYLGSNGRSLSLTTELTRFTGTIVLEDGSGWSWSSAAHYTIYISDPNGAGDQIRVLQVTVRKKGTGDMIIDGTITADKLSADAINGKTITGTTIRTPAGEGYEMIHVDNPPAGISYLEVPMPSGVEDTYMSLRQEGLLSSNLSNTVRSRIISTLLKLYNRDDSPSHLVRQIYGWYLSDMVYSPRIFTENGEVATISPNKDALTISLTPVDIGSMLQAGSPWSTLGGCYYYKIGTRVHLHIAVTGLTANTNTTAYTMESGFRPYGTVVAAGRGNNGSTFASMWVTSAGVVTVRSANTQAAVEY